MYMHYMIDYITNRLQKKCDRWLPSNCCLGNDRSKLVSVIIDVFEQLKNDLIWRDTRVQCVLHVLVCGPVQVEVVHVVAAVHHDVVEGVGEGGGERVGDDLIKGAGVLVFR